MEHLYEFQEYFYNKCHWDKNITIPDPFWQTQSKTEGHLRAPIFEEKLVQQKQTAKGGPVEWSRRERLRLSSWAGGGGELFQHGAPSMPQCQIYVVPEPVIWQISACKREAAFWQESFHASENSYSWLLSQTSGYRSRSHFLLNCLSKR